MAKRVRRKRKAAPRKGWRAQVLEPWHWLRRRALRTAGLAVLLLLASVLLFRYVPPPGTLTMLQAARELGEVERAWLPLDEIPEDVRRAALAAEDARFCQHWGFDMAAIRSALADGAARGASTISQQTVKNVWLWQGRSWPRKALEAVITPVVELAWPKRRILEVYLNVAEFDLGVFGIDAAARQYFGKAPSELSLREASLLMSVLPSPDGRDAAQPSAALRARAAAIADGAATLARNGRAACIED